MDTLATITEASGCKYPRKRGAVADWYHSFTGAKRRFHRMSQNLGIGAAANGIQMDFPVVKCLGFVFFSKIPAFGDISDQRVKVSSFSSHVFCTSKRNQAFVEKYLLNPPTTHMKINRYAVARDTSAPEKILQILKSFPARGCYLFILLLACIFPAAGARAAILTWDAGNTNNGVTIDPGSGSWSTDITTNFNWNNGTADVSWTQTSTTAGLMGAFFTGPDAADGTYQVTLDGTQVAFTNLTVNANGYVFNGPASMFMNTSGTLLVTDGKTAVFNNNFAQNNSAKFWQLGSNGLPATMVVNGNIGGDQLVFNSTNGSTFLLGGNTAASVTTIDANVWQTNGTSTGANTWQVGRAVTGSGGNSVGVFTLDGPSTVMNFTTSLQISRGGGNGTVIVQNAATMNIGLASAQNIQIESELANNSHGAFIMKDGTVNIGSVNSPTANGQIWFNKSGANTGSTAIYSQSGGTVNAWGGVAFGQVTGNFTQGFAALTNSGGFLYIGSAGIVKNLGSAATNVIDLSGGTIGCMANWISSMPMILDNLNGNITFQCSDINTTPFNISLSGALTGPGGLNKTGGGTLTLSGTNNYLGSTVISNGTLIVKAANLPTNGAVTLDGSAGNPIVSVQVGNQSQDWTMGTLTYAAGTPTMDFNFATVTPSATLAPIQVNGDLNFTVTPLVQVEGSNILSGTYPLIKYSGTLSGTPPTAIVSLPAGATSATLVNNTVNKSIDLHVNSTLTASLQWGVGDGSWDFSALNWTNVGTPGFVAYANPKPVQFNDIASGTSPIHVALNAAVGPSSVSFNGVAKSYVLAGPGSITDAGTPTTLTVSGASATLATTNSYSGGTTVAFPGQLNINYGGNGTANSAIGAGVLNINAAGATSGAKIDNTSGQAVTLSTPINENWNDDWTFVGSGNLATGPGAVTLNNASVALTVISNALEIDGSIGDNGQNDSLLKLGNGVLTLKSDNNFGGGLEIAAGTLNFGSTQNAGTGILKIDGGASFDNVSGAPLTLSGFPSVTIQAGVGETITFRGSSDLDFGGVTIAANNGGVEIWNVVTNNLIFEGDIQSGNTTITKIGKGTLVLNGIAIANQFTGIINEGELDLGKDAGSATGSGGQGLLVQSNAVVKITGAGGNQIPNSIGGGSYILTRLNAGGVLDLFGHTEGLDMLGVTNSVLRNSSDFTEAVLTIPGTTGSHPTNSLSLIGLCLFDVTNNAQLDIDSIIDGTGTLMTVGKGVVNLINQSSNIYVANFIVGAGTLNINNPTLTNTSTVTISNGAVLNLPFPNGETNIVAALTINGVSKAAGVYSASTDPTFITGSGSLQVVPIASVINPVPGPILFVNQGGGNLSLGWPTNGGWILQSNSVGLTAPGSWFAVPNSTNLTNLTVTLDPGQTNVFYRLVRPF
jgi:fibronectin-binding autotransporter adhesin